MACKSVYAADPVFVPSDVEPTGRVSVHTMIQYVDHTGRQRYRRVSLYTEYGASATAAKGIVKSMRDTNPNLNNVGGLLVIDL